MVAGGSAATTRSPPGFTSSPLSWATLPAPATISASGAGLSAGARGSMATRPRKHSATPGRPKTRGRGAYAISPAPLRRPRQRDRVSPRRPCMQWGHVCVFTGHFLFGQRAANRIDRVTVRGRSSGRKTDRGQEPLGAVAQPGGLRGRQLAGRVADDDRECLRCGAAALEASIFAQFAETQRNSFLILPQVGDARFLAVRYIPASRRCRGTDPAMRGAGVRDAA